MFRKCLMFIALCALALPVFAQEKIVLTNAAPNVTEYRITEITLAWGNPTGECRIRVTLTPNVGDVEKQQTYRGAQACGMLKQLNTANLSTMSLQKRIMTQLIADGVIVGSVTGIPE